MSSERHGREQGGPQGLESWSPDAIGSTWWVQTRIIQDNEDGIGCHGKHSLSNEVKTSWVKRLK